MLKVFIGHHPDEIYNTEVYYQNQYDKDWVLDPFARRIIADVDASEVVGADTIRNDLFGTFGSTELSAGVKTLLLMQNMPQKMFNISNCGDNCAKYLLELARDRDIKVCLHHVMDFGKDFTIRIINDRRRKDISDPVEYVMLVHRYLGEAAHEG